MAVEQLIEGNQYMFRLNHLHPPFDNVKLRRAALARMWVQDPDVILLDEPTNHLDLPTIEWLENQLANHRAGLVIVSHDRAFLGRLTKLVANLGKSLVVIPIAGRQHGLQTNLQQFTNSPGRGDRWLTGRHFG